MDDRDENGQFLVGHTQAGPGRESKYDPSMNDQARKLALLGCIDKEIAAFFGVTEATLNNWKNEHHAFFVSINEGKIQADANVAESLYHRATGQTVEIEKVLKDKEGEFEKITLKQFIPADVQAQRLWLMNRQGNRWKDKSHVEQSGEVKVVNKIEHTIVDPNVKNTDS